MSYSRAFGHSTQRGRPRGSGLIKKPEKKSTIPAKLTPELWALIQSQRQLNESLSETISRMLREANHSKIEMRKKADALEERLNGMYENRYQYYREVHDQQT